MRELSEECLRAAANILGSFSASARAIEDAERRRESGQTVKFYEVGNAIFVVDVSADSAGRDKP